MLLELGRHVSGQKDKHRIYNFDVLPLFPPTLVVGSNLIHGLQTVFLGHLKVQKHKRNRLESFTPLPLLYLTLKQSYCFVDCFLAITAKCTHLNHTQFRQLVLKHLDVHN